ncbi:MAG: hypothetical protein AAGN35_24735 [Bacteroidota bacterium]
MKRLFALPVILMVLIIPMMVSNPLIANNGGGGGSRSELEHSTVGGSTSSDIPITIVNYILELAAPQFNVSVKYLKRQYYRGFVTIAQIGQNVYAVTYGGITIQILIESGAANRGDLGIATRGLRH